MEKTTFVVINENTFGYTTERTDKAYFRVVVMAVSVLRGGDPLLLDKMVLANWQKAREATVQDFADYRVSVKGYLDDDQYVFIR